jgi:hypothetical protein
MGVIARSQTAHRATARVARTRTCEGIERDRVLVRATLAVALRASSRNIFFNLNTSYLDAYGRDKIGSLPGGGFDHPFPETVSGPLFHLPRLLLAAHRS